MQATFTLIAEQGILQRSADNYLIVIYLTKFLIVDFNSHKIHLTKELKLVVNSTL